MGLLSLEYERAREKTRDEKALANMGLSELQELRQEYESQIKKYNALRSGYSREHEKRLRAVEMLEHEVKQQSQIATRVDQIIQQWNENTMNMQSILTKIEVRVVW